MCGAVVTAVSPPCVPYVEERCLQIKDSVLHCHTADLLLNLIQSDVI